jgi:hypothetical protein
MDHEWNTGIISDVGSLLWCIFLKLVYTKFKHQQSRSALTDRRPDTRWVPKQNAEFFFSVDSFQCHAHCITSVPIDRVFNIKKYTHWTWVNFLCVLCPVMFLHPAATVVYIAVCCAGIFFLNWITIEILKKRNKLALHLVKPVFGLQYKHNSKS